MALTIDAHQHVWNLRVSPYTWLQGAPWPAIRRDFSCADLKPALADCGIQKTILVQVDNSQADADFVRQAALDEPMVAGFVGWVPLDRPAELEAALDKQALGGKLIGIRHVLSFEPDDDWVMRPQVLEGLSVLEARGLPFELNCDKPVYLPRVPELVRHCPRLTIIVNHLGKPPIGARGWEPWATHFAAAAACENVYVKLSGLTTPYREGWSGADFKPYVDFALERFGPARLMYASNWPVTLVAGSYQRQYHELRSVIAALSDSEREAILGGTAARCYGIKT